VIDVCPMGCGREVDPADELGTCGFHSCRELLRLKRRELQLRASMMYTEKMMTVHEVARELGVSYGKAHALIKESGEEFRSRGITPRKPHRNEVEDFLS
jgi:hypothetical protein